MNDVLTIDSLQLSRWEQDPRFDYDRELMNDGQNLLEWLNSIFWEWFGRTLDTLLDSKPMTYALIVTGIVLLAFIFWWVWKSHPALFMRSGDDSPLDYDAQQDTIYGVDFEADIANARARGDYRQAVRLVYLQTLKKLSDAGRIDWQPSKTPMQYMRQIDSPPFHELSRHFVRVRYGNFEATEELFQQMKALQAGAVGAAGTTESSEATETQSPQKPQPQKGGEQ